jgi:hypothetical protein
VTGTNGLDLDLLENVDACLFDGEGRDLAPSSSALHVYPEATVPRVRSCGTLRGVVWFQNESERPLGVWLNRTLPLDRTMRFTVTDAQGHPIDPPDRPPVKACKPLPIAAKLLGFVIAPGERVGKRFEWRPRFHVWGATSAPERCGFERPEESGESLPGGSYWLKVTPPFPSNVRPASLVRIDPLEVLVE